MAPPPRAWYIDSVPGELPRWVISGAESARGKARRGRSRSLQERLLDSEAVCATAAWMLALSAQRDRALAWVDPLPLSAREALRRLRKEARQPWISDG